jgi:Tetratricopeptide repeat
METGHELFYDWLKKGRKEPMGDALRYHMEVCEQCSGELAEFNEFGEIYDLPSPSLTAEQFALIQLRLDAESNERALHGVTITDAPHNWYRWGALAAGVVLMISTLIIGTLLISKSGGVEAGETVSKASITAEPGAKWHYVSTGKTEFVCVSSGSVHFKVRPLINGENFGVKVGSEWVEVRGTQFTVTVKESVFQKVSVQEGVVAVHVGKGSILLLAGQEWVRKKSSLGLNKEVMVAKTKETTSPSIVKEKVSLQNSKVSTEVGTKALPLNKKPIKKSMGVKITGSSENLSTSKDKVINVKSLSKTPKVKLNDSPLPKRFTDAYRILLSGNWQRAVTLFRALLKERGLGSKRPDTLFWLSQAHLKGGEYSLARKRLKQFIRLYPGSWRAKDAKKQLKLLESRLR